MKIVNVLMSTYNGEKFVSEQINSILKQEGVQVNLYIRDDGSKDNTVNIIKEYTNSYHNIHCYYENNVGWRDSFIKLLFSIPVRRNEYYALADQDDVWESKKLLSAIKKICKVESPALYHSNMTIVDKNLNYVRLKYPESLKITNNYKRAFFDGIGTGSTMVFNSALLQLIKQYRPNESLAHDAYIFALANLLGDVIYDKDSYILYRRFGGNATGFKKDNVYKNPTIFERYKRYKKSPKNPYSIRARQILLGYGNQLSLKEKKFLSDISNYNKNIFNRVVLLFNPNVRASSFKKTLFIKYRILSDTL